MSKASIIPMSTQNEKNLIILAQNGNQAAMTELCKRSKSVTYHVQKYDRQNQFREDLLVAAQMGLVKAVLKFDVSRSNQLDTFAESYIKNEVLQTLTEMTQTVRVPKDVQEGWKNIRKARNAFIQHFGEEPTEYDLAEELGMDVYEVQRCMYDGRVESFDDAEDGSCYNERLYLEAEGSCDGFESADGELIRTETLENSMALLKNLLTPDEFTVLVTVRSYPGHEAGRGLRQVARDLGFTESQTYHLWENAKRKIWAHITDFGLAA